MAFRSARRGSRVLAGADKRARHDGPAALRGRNSLLIGVSALITAVFAVVVGILSGYFRGAVDAVLSRTMDVIWAFPVILLGIALGTAFALSGLDLGVVQIGGLQADPDPDHRDRLHPLHGASDSRTGLRPSRARVRRGSTGTRAGRCGSCSRRSRPTSRRRSSSSSPDGGQRDPARGRARVRRGGRAAARALVGDDDRGWGGAHPHRSPSGDRAGDDARHRGAGAERVRRRCARCLRPAATVLER